MSDPVKPPLRPAYAFQRTGKKMRGGRFLEVGNFRVDERSNTHLFMDRTPIGGFTGYVLMPSDGKPPEIQPERPDDSDSEE